VGQAIGLYAALHAADRKAVRRLPCHRMLLDGNELLTVAGNGLFSELHNPVGILVTARGKGKVVASIAPQCGRRRAKKGAMVDFCELPAKFPAGRENLRG
jgi:hypothetical protein